MRPLPLAIVLWGAFTLAMVTACKLAKSESSHTMDERGTEEGPFLIPMHPDDIYRIAWSDREGRQHVWAREDSIWYYAGMEAVDQEAFGRYLQKITGIQGEMPDKEVNPVGLIRIESLVVSGLNGESSIILNAYSNVDRHSPFLLHSSHLPDDYFQTDTSGLYGHIFGDLRTFWP